MPYLTKTGLTNDKTSKSFKPGDVVQDGDFPKYIIEGWLKRGHLVEVESNGSDSNDREN